MHLFYWRYLKSPKPNILIPRRQLNPQYAKNGYAMEFIL